MKLPSLITALRADPRVGAAWSETGTGDGYWVMLNRGFADLTWDPHQPTHTIHEWTLTDLRRRMKSVGTCACKECVR